MNDNTGRVNICYKLLDGSLPLSFDAYLPSKENERYSEKSDVPAVIYFHGGGLTVGNKESWMPVWLKKRVLGLGFIFISADYQLIPPSTGHDVIKDIQDLFAFIASYEFRDAGHVFRVDINRIVVSGSSAGGLCAYLAAMHCSPRPRAILSMYGMGGNFLTSHYLVPKSKVFFRGRELLDPTDFSEYIYPQSGYLPAIADSPLAYHPQTYHIPGYPANPRMLLARLYLQLGTFLDYYTGAHVPSLSAVLRQPLNLNSGHNDGLIPEEHRPLFPQFFVNADYPPTLLLHGTHDTAVLVEESRNLKAKLEMEGVSVKLIEFEGEEHSFDYELGAEEKWRVQFDDVKDFLCDRLGV